MTNHQHWEQLHSWHKRNTLVVIEFPDSLFQISNTTVDELGTLGASTRGEIVSLDHGDLQATSGSIEGDTGAGCTSANDQEIVFLALATLVVGLDITRRAGNSLGNLVSGILQGTSDGACRSLEVGDLSGARLDLREVGRVEDTALAVGWRRNSSGL